MRTRRARASAVQTAKAEHTFHSHPLQSFLSDQPPETASSTLPTEVGEVALLKVHLTWSGGGRPRLRLIVDLHAVRSRRKNGAHRQESPFFACCARELNPAAVSSLRLPKPRL